ncbi:MAG: hypothetical protein ACRBN8_43050 [Nannocystales bacterium]
MTIFRRIHRRHDTIFATRGVGRGEPAVWLAAALGLASLVLARAALSLAPDA